MEKYYCFGGLQLTVQLPGEYMYTDDGVLAPFRVPSVEAPHVFSFHMVEALTPPDGTRIENNPDFHVYDYNGVQLRYIGTAKDGVSGAYIRAVHRGKDHLVEVKKGQYTKGITPKTVLNAMAVEHLFAQLGGFVFHTAFVNVHGEAILFTAPSGTGKSTQAELWRTLRGAEIINGDRAAVRITDDGIFACGIPFAGSSKICKNKTLPVKAVVYLSQAPKTTIRQLRGLEAFRSIWEGVSVNTWDADDVSRISQSVQQIALEIPVYHLACTPDESAVTVLEQALRK